MRLTLLVASLASLAAPFHGARALGEGLPIGPESRIWITGASNIRRFTCKARQVTGIVQLRGTATRTAVLSGQNVAAQPSVSVPVAKLDCGIGIMNHHLRDALRGTAHPTIEFRLATYEVDLLAAVPAARITGLVTIAGVQRAVTTTAVVRCDTLGTLRVVGSYTVRPTDFGVRPPHRFGGLLRVRDRITVHFDVALDPDSGAIDEIGGSLVQPAATPSR
jgi:polyisoprenoid-binding protein YceI